MAVMSPKKRPPSAAGTYGIIGPLKRPSLFVRLPPDAESAADVATVHRGQTLRVSCFLRGTHAPFPPRLRQGSLYVSKDTLQWKPFWPIARAPVQLTGPAESVVTRPADHREPGVKRGDSGGRRYWLVTAQAFVVVTCQTKSGAFDLVVPAVDVPVVIDRLSPHGQRAE